MNLFNYRSILEMINLFCFAYRLRLWNGVICQLPQRIVGMLIEEETFLNIQGRFLACSMEVVPQISSLWWDRLSCRIIQSSRRTFKKKKTLDVRLSVCMSVRVSAKWLHGFYIQKKCWLKTILSRMHDPRLFPPPRIIIKTIFNVWSVKLCWYHIL